jgi:rsbT antagonist protein RsbS
VGQIPILKVGPVLLVSIQTELHDRIAEELQDDVLTAFRDTGAEGVVIDITAVEMVDSFIGRVLSDTARMAHVMGGKVVLVGLQPSVTMSLLELGLNLPGIQSAMDVEAGLACLGCRLVRLSRGEAEPAGVSEVRHDGG